MSLKSKAATMMGLSYSKNEKSMKLFENHYEKNSDLVLPKNMSLIWAKLFLLAVLMIGVFTADKIVPPNGSSPRTDMHDILDQVVIANARIVLMKDKDFISLFKNEKDVKPLSHCGKFIGCYVFIGDVLKNTALLKSPNTAINDMCRISVGYKEIYSVPLEFDIKEVKVETGKSVSECVLTNEKEVRSMDFLNYKWELLTILINTVAFVSFFLLRAIRLK